MKIDVDFEELSHVKAVYLGMHPGVDLITLRDGRVLGIDRDGLMRIFIYKDEEDFYEGNGGDFLVKF